MAGTVTTAFEDFTTGSVNGQMGWRSGLDQAVVPSGGVATFGNQSLRRSNFTASSAFDNQTYSPPVSPPAGENQANTVYIAKFSFFAPAHQPGLDVTVSPDSGDGSRMAWVDLLDQEDGVHITASDSAGADGDFVTYDLGTLSHGRPHTIEFRIKLVPGEANDLVRILVDDEDAGQCFTTWETYYRVDPAQSVAPNFSEPPNINSLQFRTSVPTFHVPDAGYLFDNITVTTGTGPDSPGCDVTLDKQASESTVTAGGLANYTLTARNRGRAVARNVRVCDRIPRGTTFVRADRKLQRVGRSRCFVIPSLKPGQRESVDVVLRVNADYPRGTLTNIADLLPGLPGTPVAPGLDLPAPPAPGAPGAPGTPGTPVTPGTPKAQAVRKAKVIVKVLARRAGRRPPAVTG